jgi:hypothetical protein
VADTFLPHLDGCSGINPFTPSDVPSTEHRSSDLIEQCRDTNAIVLALLSWGSTTTPRSLTQVAVRRCRKRRNPATTVPEDFKGEGIVTLSGNNFSDEEPRRPMESLLAADERNIHRFNIINLNGQGWLVSSRSALSFGPTRGGVFALLCRID